MIKKITLLLLFVAAFSWQGTAQLTEDFEGGMVSLVNATGNDTDFVVETTLFHGGAQSVKNAYGSSDTNILEQPAAMDLSGTTNPLLTFWHIAKTEGTYDKCYVEISTDGGTTYAALTSSDYLSSSSDYAAKGYFHEDSYTEWGTGSTPAADNTWWKKEEFSLSAYIGATVKIRFKLTGDGSVNREGWYIDDVTVTDPAYMSPAATYTAVNDCANSQFTVNVDVTDLGGAGSVTIADDQSSATQTVSATGVVNFGPYPTGTTVAFTITNDDDTSFSSSNSFTFNCPPDNDECSGAIALTVNTDLACGTVTAGTVLAATASSTDDTACYGTENNDVWFSFQATATAHKVELLNVSGSTTDMFNSIWEGSCGSLTLVPNSCSDPNINSLTGLTVGNTYYVRVNTYSSADADTTFDICVGTPPPPPANDECADATTITESTDYNCDNAVSGTTVSATHSSDNTNQSSSYKDVWYTFTPNATGNYIFTTTTNSGSNAYLTVWSGSCGSLTEESSGSYLSSYTLAVTAGTQYYVSAASLSDTSVFDLCVYPEPSAPGNDDCSGATVVTESADYNCDNAVSGTTISATYSSDNTNQSSSYEDVWYTFTPDSTGDYIFSATTNSGSTAYITVWSGSCGSFTEISSGGTALRSDIVSVTAGTQYYVSVASYSDTSVFDLCVYPMPAAPANDACADATEVATLPYADFVDATSATNNDGFITACSNGMNDGIWYTFTVGDSGTVTITAEATTSWDAEIGIYTGSCGSLTCVDRVDSSGSGGTESYDLDAAAGTQYWVNIAYFSDTTDGLEGPVNVSITTADGATLGTQEAQSIAGFAYYPNPVNNQLSLRANNTIDQVEILNILGQTVLTAKPSTTSTAIDMTALNQGTYFVRVQAGDAIQTVKVIKN